ncbi:unnamed protein product [Effrenium voratum]|nr:unnamed protein product [Effrenium voratum]
MAEPPANESWISRAWTQLSDDSSPLSFLLGNSLDTAFKYGLDTSFGFIQTVCAIVGAVTVTGAAKRALYPQARPVEPLFNRLRTEGGPVRWMHQRIRFRTDPYKPLRNNKIVILQGPTQSGKTTLLRTAIPWYRRWTVWPLSMACWRGIYLAGSEAFRTDTFQQWVTFQMFGSMVKAGSEIKHCVWAYRQQQWLCIILEKLRMPSAIFLPKPVYIIVDQFEELLRRYPDHAMAWADSICHKHARNNYARIVFVVNSDFGAESLLHLATHGISFVRVHHTAPTEAERLGTLDRHLLQQCQQNIGLYWTVRYRLRIGELLPCEIDDFAKHTLARWKRDFSVPFPVMPHPSWFRLPLDEAKRELMKGLAALLVAPWRTREYNFFRMAGITSTVARQLELLDSTQLFDTSAADYAKLLSNENSKEALLTQQEAKAVAKHLRRLFGNPVGTFTAEKPKLAAWRRMLCRWSDAGLGASENTY